MYYIVGKTEYGDTLFWSGIDWEVSIGYAQQYGALEGSFEVGTFVLNNTIVPKTRFHFRTPFPLVDFSGCATAHCSPIKAWLALTFEMHWEGPPAAFHC